MFDKNILEKRRVGFLWLKDSFNVCIKQDHNQVNAKFCGSQTGVVLNTVLRVGWNSYIHPFCLSDPDVRNIHVTIYLSSNLDRLGAKNISVDFNLSRW